MWLWSGDRATGKSPTSLKMNTIEYLKRLKKKLLSGGRKFGTTSTQITWKIYNVLNKLDKMKS